MSTRLAKRDTKARTRLEVTFSNGHERTVTSDWMEPWLEGDQRRRFADNQQKAMTQEGRSMRVVIARMTVHTDTRETETWLHTFDKTKLREERTPADE